MTEVSVAFQTKGVKYKNFLDGISHYLDFSSWIKYYIAI